MRMVWPVSLTFHLHTLNGTGHYVDRLWSLVYTRFIRNTSPNWISLNNLMQVVTEEFRMCTIITMSCYPSIDWRKPSRETTQTWLHGTPISNNGTCISLMDILWKVRLTGQINRNICVVYPLRFFNITSSDKMYICLARPMGRVWPFILNIDTN